MPKKAKIWLSIVTAVLVIIVLGVLTNWFGLTGSSNDSNTGGDSGSGTSGTKPAPIHEEQVIEIPAPTLPQSFGWYAFDAPMEGTPCQEFDTSPGDKNFDGTPNILDKFPQHAHLYMQVCGTFEDDDLPLILKTGIKNGRVVEVKALNEAYGIHTWVDANKFHTRKEFNGKPVENPKRMYVGYVLKTLTFEELSKTPPAEFLKFKKENRKRAPL